MQDEVHENTVASEALKLANRLSKAAEALGLTVGEFTDLFNARIGLTSTSDLDDAEIFKFGDFLKKFEEQPIGKVRKAFAALKDGKKEGTVAVTGGCETDERTAQLRALGYKLKLEDAPTDLLLPMYRADKPSDPVSVTLKKRFGDKRIIAFREDGSVAVTETMQYIADLEQHFPERETITVDGSLTKLWPIGAKPDTMVEEDPLFPGQPLRNGYSIVNNRNWTSVSQEKRQLCRIIVERGDIDPQNKEAVLRLLERAATETGLKDAYPEADLQFREQKKADTLPKLKVMLGSASSRPNNPFGVRRSY